MAPLVVGRGAPTSCFLCNANPPEDINAAGMVAGWFSNDTFINDQLQRSEDGRLCDVAGSRAYPVPTSGDDPDVALAPAKYFEVDFRGSMASAGDVAG